MPERNEDQREEQLLDRVYVFECLEEVLDIVVLRLGAGDRDGTHDWLVPVRCPPFGHDQGGRQHAGR